MQIRSLGGVSWGELAPVFNEAFSDYAVPMAMTADSLANMQRRRGYVAEVSFGAWDGSRLVGFVLTCVEGDRAYNSGTGVVPSHRRGGLARELVDTVIASVPARSYVLEVLEDNARAIALYLGAGFVETRRFRCWTFDRRGDDVPAIPAPDLAAIAARADVDLSWQNSLASLRRAREPYVVIGDDAGAAVVFPANGDLPLLAVARDARRRGHGTRLLRAAAARASRPLRILNIDSSADDIAAFLAATGAAPLARQIEMVRERDG
ncbi:MAG TPA: GNAT family N-acetyltransferase [Kofleriaceae bacterium]|nr:GNAT family N-acetyltransferase [Kofleriaceae bacterium]